MEFDEPRKRNLEKELIFSASRSSGPGGQNVNKVSSRIELRFNVTDSVFLTDDEKELIFQKLKNRINAEGELILTSQAERSQLKNKEKVRDNFFRLLTRTLTINPPRISTKPSASSKKERLESKRKRSLIKKARGIIKRQAEEF